MKRFRTPQGRKHLRRSWGIPGSRRTTQTFETETEKKLPPPGGARASLELLNKEVKYLNEPNIKYQDENLPICIPPAPTRDGNLPSSHLFFSFLFHIRKFELCGGSWGFGDAFIPGGCETSSYNRKVSKPSTRHPEEVAPWNTRYCFTTTNTFSFLK